MVGPRSVREFVRELNPKPPIVEKRERRMFNDFGRRLFGGGFGICWSELERVERLGSLRTRWSQVQFLPGGPSIYHPAMTIFVGLAISIGWE